jgi:hypothetical protein
MKKIPFYIITAALVAMAPIARAEHKTPTVGLYGQSLKAKTEKTDIFGRTKTTHQSRYGLKVGTSTAEKPDIFGRKKTEIKDKYGRVIGTAVTEKPDIFGRVKTTYKDKSGRKVGSATTEKPDIFGNRKTTHKGHNPFNLFQKKEKRD